MLILITLYMCKVTLPSLYILHILCILHISVAHVIQSFDCEMLILLNDLSI